MLKPPIAYNVDKLDLVFSISEDFQFPDNVEVIKKPKAISVNPMEKIQLWNVSPVIPIYIVFIFKEGIPMEGTFKKKNPPIDLFCEFAGNCYYIGKLSTHLQGALRLEVDNEFLYTNLWKYLPLLEESLNIKLI